MEEQHLEQSVRDLVRAAIVAGQRVRDVVRAFGHTNPVGNSNSKVTMPATYRPVGATCPSTCPQLPKALGGTSNTRACLALNGNVQLHQKRATPLLWSSMRAATIAVVSAARWGQVARLHVSGDLCGTDGKVDVEYVNALIIMARAVRESLRLPEGTVLAFGYTHLTRAELGDHWQQMFDAGIVFRFSGDNGKWGAVVTDDREGAPRIARELGATFCPEQAVHDADKAKPVKRVVTCESCTLCWTKDRLILFRPSNGAKPNVDTGGACAN